jgi:hypothetical protein
LVRVGLLRAAIGQHNQQVEIAVGPRVPSRSATEQPNGIRSQLEDKAVLQEAKRRGFASEWPDPLRRTVLRKALGTSPPQFAWATRSRSAAAAAVRPNHSRSHATLNLSRNPSSCGLVK